MIILTDHARDRIKDRYHHSEEHFINEMKKVFDGIRKKKIYKYIIRPGSNGCSILYYKEHKIVYYKDKGNYIIVTYGQIRPKL